MRCNRSKPLLRAAGDNNNSKARFFSPHKVQIMMEENEAAKAQKEAEKAAKAAKKASAAANKRLQQAQKQQCQVDT